MISHHEFAQLRLSQFFSGNSIAKLGKWEFMDRIWVGEAIGFSEWLCPEEQPEALQSLAIDFSELPKDGCEKILRILGLPLRPGMNAEEIKREIGTPFKIYEFVPDRKSYDFRHGEEEYMISCTVKNEGGLSYLVVMVAK